MSDTAVLVVDMMNSYQHPDPEPLTPNVAKIIEPLTDLVRRAGESDDVDLVYVNDNYGDFTADFSDIVRSACDGARPDLVDPIVPTTGQCILYSALDAYVRHFPVGVPTDAVAHIDAELGAAALKMMEQNMDAELTSAADCLG
jgi:nicotinamidase-related amidase